MTLLYIAKDLRSLRLAIPFDDPPAILWTTFSGEREVTRVYRLTPLLYAALELQTDALDQAAITGRLTPEQVSRVAERLERIRTHANEWIDWNSVAEARRVLGTQPDALAWVLTKYLDRCGGTSEVEELERAAKFDPWHDGASHTDANESRLRTEEEQSEATDQVRSQLQSQV